ncbi:cellulose synthase subunit BcsC-related outer membrane protein [Xenophilus arseniciresistens]|uniref:Cellulose synthase subunit BcsC-related outer membrane protein n=1 Tax=Xenophilus arseniciresistens TaxID=1283306 RepID=A0AAE3N514_9BURK|nr:cellulose synthase subunit BcsC-related outer membrane protein [Xenophilus arseniciresistens]MDA7415675.1 cellulose synthase subunit BcsC-related outer membrane protein [Xenophilus arseniciresistens]
MQHRRQGLTPPGCGLRQLVAALGAAGLLCAGAVAHAQDDGRAALAEQGAYWQNMGRNDLAEENWRKLLRLDANSADALYGMAQVELARGRAEQAQPWIDRLRAAHPRDARLARLAAGGPAMSDLQRARAAAQAGRVAEAVQLYRSVIGNQAPPPNLAREYYELLSGSPQDGEEGLRGLQNLLRQQPDNAELRIAVARAQTYREATRREGIRSLSEIAGAGGSAAAPARNSWRQALIWLDARERDIPLYEAFLAGGQDDAVAARLQAIRTPPTTAEGTPASPAAQPVAEGFRAIERGDLAGAEQRFQDALRRQSGYAEAQGGLGIVRLRQERFGEAQQLLEQASRGGGGNRFASALRSASYWALMRQGDSAREQNDLRNARSLYERAVRIDGREPTGLNALADLQAAEGQYAEAEANYRRVLEARADDAQALRGLIVVYTQTGRADEAQKLMARLTPEQLREAGGLRNLRAAQARSQARARLEAGDVAGSQRLLEDAMLQNPDDPWLRLDLAQIYRRGGQLAQARSVMDGLLMSQPEMPDALFASALLAGDAGDGAGGLAYLERIPAASRTREMRELQRRLWVQTQTQRALALARQGQQAAARAVLSAAESSLGRDMSSDIWGPLAEAYAEVGDAPRALAMSRQLLARHPSPAIGDRLLYASVLVKSKQDVELAALLRQLQATPMTPAQRAQFDGLRKGYLLRQADVLREAGNLEAAFNMLSPLLAAQPDDAGTLGALARLYSTARDETQALAIYQRILQRNPTDLDTLLAAAASASAARAHGDAQSYVMAALKQAPEQARVLAAAGRVFRNAGDNRLAEQYLQAAVTAEQRLANPWSPSQTPAAPGAAPLAGGNPFAGMTGRNLPGLPVPNAMAAAPMLPAPAMLPVSAPSAAAGAGLPPPPAWTGLPATAPAAAAMPLPTQPAGALPWPENPAAPAANAPAARPGAGASTTRRGSGNRAASTAAARNVPDAAAYAAPPAGTAPPVYASGLPAPAASAGYAADIGIPAPAQYGGLPLPVPAGYPQAQAWPAPGTGGLPPPTGAAAAGTGLWSTGAPVLNAPVDPLRAELDQLRSERSSSISMGMVYRNREGEDGLSRLADIQVPIEGRISVGEGKVVLSATPTTLDAGTPAYTFSTAARYGAGPAAALAQVYNVVPSPGAQTATGVGLSVGYESKNFDAAVGTTPLGFQESNVIGHLRYRGNVTDSLSLKGELSRKPVTDSLLSFAGTEDVRTGDRWGGVVATGGRGDVTWDSGSFGLYGYGSYHALTGNNVADNFRVEGGGGFYAHLLRNDTHTLTAGMNVGLLHYDKNLSYFTFGHGGYFSPQRYIGLDFPVSWSGKHNRLAWRVNASLGVQSFTQDETPYFPTDAVRQSQVYEAMGQATALQLNNTVFTGYYPSTSRTGLAYNLGAALEYQVAPQLFLGGTVGLSNARNYRQFSGNVYLRYQFDNKGSSLLNVPPSLSPLTSPYTPM